MYKLTKELTGKEKISLAKKLQGLNAKERSGVINGSQADYLKVYDARILGEWEDVYQTRLYEKYGGEYCQLLCILHNEYKISKS